MNAVNFATPIWLSEAYPWMPTSVPAKKAMNAITPTVPAMTDSPPTPKATSARIEAISRR
jgi:hypothetical protein